MIRNLSEKHSLASVFLSEIRDVHVQQDAMRFRRNMERLGEIIAFEISKELEYKTEEIETPLGTSAMQVLKTQPVVGSILRAGLTLHQGILNFYDKAENAFISAYRKHDQTGEFTIRLEYVSCPDLEGKVLILADPMLATGASMVITMKELMRYGKPAHTHIATAIASTQGVDEIQRRLDNFTLWTAAIDDELTAKGYIVPGLGDAGDLSFGEKIQY